MEDKMFAAVFEGEGKLVLKEMPHPKIAKNDEVLLEVRATGICGTDLHILSVPPGHPANPEVILGHEYTARIVEVGPAVTHLRPGDHVVIDPNITCGHCTYCLMGYPNSCENMTSLGIFINGGLARFNTAPAKALHKISSEVPPHLAALAEPLSCIINGTQKLKLHPGESVVVLGAGPIGLLFIQMFKAAGAGKILVGEISSYRSEYALKLGADVVINPEKENLQQAVKEETGLGADVAVDTVGSLFRQAVEVVRLGGKILLFGMNQHARPPIKQYDITRNEITVMGTYIALNTFPLAVKTIERGVLDLEALISHKISLKEIHEGLNALKEGRATKVLVTEF
jgi:threonine dehydrogenase-like Zn-dependent dehydrogenase